MLDRPWQLHQPGIEQYETDGNVPEAITIEKCISKR